MFKEFREFIARGNVIDLAIGVIIGAAFGKIVTSLVEDIINPILGLILGRVDFSNLFISLDGKTYASLAAAKEAGGAVLAYGNFINTIIQFIIVAFVLFLVIRQVNAMRRQPETAPEAPAPTTEEKLLTEIRDLLKAR